MLSNKSGDFFAVTFAKLCPKDGIFKKRGREKEDIHTYIISHITEIAYLFVTPHASIKTTGGARKQQQQRDICVSQCSVYWVKL